MSNNFEGRKIMTTDRTQDEQDEKVKVMRTRNGFIAALDQSGGSAPGVLKNYGIPRTEYSTDEERDALIHTMRIRIMQAPTFNGHRILGTILFWDTMISELNDKPLPQFLWENLKVLSFLKIDAGMEDEHDSVQLLKPIPDMEERLITAVNLGVCGTKMRSVINRATRSGINELVAQQFEVGKIIAKFGLIPIIEPEVTISSPDKAECEEILVDEIMDNLNGLDNQETAALKLTLPEIPNIYRDIASHKNVARVTALSGGYSQDEACRRLGENAGMIASFSRAFTEGLNVSQGGKEFNAVLDSSIERIFQASIT